MTDQQIYIKTEPGGKIIFCNKYIYLNAGNELI